ncbi:Uncharacterized protein Rs2_41115 [Raphanus sativus]|nr:Uncharacterized protein Rs2_41115 [Raphanus sativus]
MRKRIIKTGYPTDTDPSAGATNGTRPRAPVFATTPRPRAPAVATTPRPRAPAVATTPRFWALASVTTLWFHSPVSVTVLRVSSPGECGQSFVNHPHYRTSSKQLSLRTRLVSVLSRPARHMANSILLKSAFQKRSDFYKITQSLND